MVYSYRSCYISSRESFPSFPDFAGMLPPGAKRQNKVRPHAECFDMTVDQVASEIHGDAIKGSNGIQLIYQHL